jgi:hypothetical protein
VLMFGDMSFAPGIAAVMSGVRKYTTSTPSRFFIGFEGAREEGGD